MDARHSRRKTSIWDKVESHLIGCAERPNRLVFLVLSGSLNPPHTQHMRALEVARAECERLAWIPVGGFLAPSSDDYVRQKLGREAWPLTTRTRLCELATVDSDWIGVWPRGELSGHRVCLEIQAQLLRDQGELVRGQVVTGVEVMGSDTAIRILDKVIADWTDTTGGTGEPWYRDRVVLCVVRPGRNGNEEAAHVRAVTVPRAVALGVRVVLVDSTAEQPPEPVGSTEIRELIAAADWPGLRLRGWLHPRVLQALQASENRP